MKNQNKRISIRDIADKVGVSTALVSYVLSGKEKEKRVGAEVAGRIREVARELNYTPNQIAQSLRIGATRTIGLIVTDIANPFFGTLARIIEDEANTNNYTLLIGSSDEDCDKSSMLLNTFLDRRVDGLIIVPADGQIDCYKTIVDRDIPMVLIDRYLSELATSYVVLDNYKACYEATTYLIEKGYRRIGIVAYKNSLIHMKERIRGYSQAMLDKRRKEKLVIKEIKYTHFDKDTETVMRSLTMGKDKVEAIVIANNTLTIRILYYLSQNKISVPDDLDVVGFDGNEAFDFFNPPINYVRQPVDEMAKESFQILLDQINGSQRITQVIMQSQLVIQ